MRLAAGGADGAESLLPPISQIPLERSSHRHLERSKPSSQILVTALHPSSFIQHTKHQTPWRYWH
eukprot:scaffold4568_cov74-Cyclotella_meneghiniana.AAC.2